MTDLTLILTLTLLRKLVTSVDIVHEPTFISLSTTSHIFFETQGI